MRQGCPVEAAILVVVIVLAAGVSAREIGHAWAEETVPTIRVARVSAGCGRQEREGKHQSSRVAIVSPDRIAGRAGPLAARAPAGQARSLAAALLAWVAAATGHPVPDTPPDVVTLTEADFELYLCEQVEQCHLEVRPAEILAFFDVESRAIYIPEKFDPDDVEHQSAMVRELVHFLEAHAGRSPGCRGLLAQEARQVANRWRAGRGLPAAPPTLFEILLQSCVPGWT
jgi:hypothetical protein